MAHLEEYQAELRKKHKNTESAVEEALQKITAMKQIIDKNQRNCKQIKLEYWSSLHEKNERIHRTY